MVFVLDRHHKPVMPCSEKRARLLLERGRARVHQMVPFTIRLVDRLREDSVLQDLRVKLDPGSKTTGVAVTCEGAQGTAVVFLGEIVHKPGIKARLDARRAIRRGRRFRHTRYRQPRFQNRQRPDGWLPPSLEARVNQTLQTLDKIECGAPITAISVEHVKFDTQKMANPEISGAEYQPGTPLGYEVREYLLEKWGRACVYCEAMDVPLEIEHLVPKSRGGSNRVGNLALACHACNQQKNSQTATEFGYPQLLAQAQKPLKEAAMMNATRWRLYDQLNATGRPVEGGSGACTKMQRVAHDLPKEHYYDALCVGSSTPETFTTLSVYVQIWSAKGRGNRQRCRMDPYGFPKRHLSGKKQHFEFRTGDRVRAIVSTGTFAGTWVGRVTVRARGVFVITMADGSRVEVSHQVCQLVQRGNGWQITQKYANQERGQAASASA